MPGQWKVCTRRSILIAIEAVAWSGWGDYFIPLTATHDGRRTPESRGVATTVELSERVGGS